MPKIQKKYIEKLHFLTIFTYQPQFTDNETMNFNHVFIQKTFCKGTNKQNTPAPWL